jgi:peptidoglycan/LPS O-acetylase OafA/YrhL
MTETTLAPPGRSATGPAGTAAGRTRLDTLTGLRFFAALAVVLIHVGPRFARAKWLSAADDLGYVGVGFFFLLSGFVLTWSYSGGSARRFWWLRFARVWPAQFVLALFAMSVIAAREHLPGRWGRAGELVLLQAWSPDVRVYYGGNGVSWSLSAELFFYLLFPLAIVALRRLRGRGLLVTAAVTVAVMAAAPLVASSIGVSDATYSWLFFVFPPYRFAEFLLGMVLARAVQLGLRLPAPGWTALGALAGLAVAIWWLTDLTLHTGTVAQRPFVALLMLPFFAVFLLAGATRDLQRRHWWLGSRPLLRLGEWSFALYLVHKPLFLLTDQWKWWNNAGGFSGLTAFCEYLACAVAAAALVHHLLEKPVERALRRLFVNG